MPPVSRVRPQQPPKRERLCPGTISPAVGMVAPWGQGPRGSGPTPPDLEELLKRSQDRLRQILPGGGGRGGGGGGGFNPLTLIIVLVVVAAFLGYNFFTFRVQPDELGVVLRFGAFDRQAQPGLNFRLPYPIDIVYTPKVTRCEPGDDRPRFPTTWARPGWAVIFRKRA